MGETSFVERASNSPGGERTKIEEDCVSPDDAEPRDECCDDGKESLEQPSTDSKDWAINFFGVELLLHGYSSSLPYIICLPLIHFE